jgi:hypothetical protein
MKNTFHGKYILLLRLLQKYEIQLKLLKVRFTLVTFLLIVSTRISGVDPEQENVLPVKSIFHEP